MRFARAPDGAVAFDVKAVLPGRGAWVCVDGGCLEKATAPKQGGLWSHAFDAPVVVDGAALRDRVRALLLDDVLSRLGLLRRQGLLVLGRDEVIRKIAGLAVIGLAVDLSENSRHEVTEALQKAAPSTPLATLALPSMADIADAVGSRVVGVVGVGKGGGVDAFVVALRRWAGR